MSSACPKQPQARARDMRQRMIHPPMRKSIAGCALLASTAAALAQQPQIFQGPGLPQVTVSGLHPGGAPAVAQVSAIGRKYDGNPQYVEEGRQLYVGFNCIGCHANGGGGMGPPLTKHEWRYGSSIENIAADVFEGRPNGMPAWRGKIPDEQIWAIAAYVRSLTPNGPTKPM